MATRDGLRNVAIIAHVDHGKTTLVDALLRQSGTLSDRKEPIDRILDSMDLEREKGITILAKQAAFEFGERRLNIVDTPGHADFGGEVERALAMVDGAMLLVDAAEGPRPQTRFVLRKAFAARLPVIVIVNKVDRPDARIAEVVEETLELFLELGAPDEQFDVPFLFGSARDGWVDQTEPTGPGAPAPSRASLDPLIDAIFDYLPPPSFSDGAPLQARVTNLDGSPYLGRLGICRIVEGTLRRGEAVAWCRRDGTIQRARCVELLVASGLERVSVDEVTAGDLAAVSGIPEVMVGETLAALDDPRPLDVLTVDEPSLSMTFGVNSSPLSGREGTKMTARLLKARLEAEALGNVAIRVSREQDAPIPSRCKGAVNSPSPCSSNSCGEKVSSSPSANQRCCCERSTASSPSRSSGCSSRFRRSTSVPSPSSSRRGRLASSGRSMKTTAGC